MSVKDDLFHDRHVSLDIEACGDVLLSVGACYFDIATGEPQETYYAALQVQPQLDAGLSMSGSAWEWWMKQSDAARSALANPVAPQEALLNLWRFVCGEKKKAEYPWVWMYPTSFDLPVIERVCRKFSVEVPWKYTKTMDGRTIWRLACAINIDAEKIEKANNDIPHHALEDAKEQARWYSRYLCTVMTGQTTPEACP